MNSKSLRVELTLDNSRIISHYYEFDGGNPGDDLLELIVPIYGNSIVGISECADWDGPVRGWPAPPARSLRTKQINDAERLEGLADGLQASIDHGRAPLTQNWTPRRADIKEGQRLKADYEEEVQRGLRACASALRDGELPPILAPHLTKSGIGRVLDRYKEPKAVGEALNRLMEERCPAPPRVESREEVVARMSDDLRGRKIPGFFPTPPKLVEQVIEHLELRDKTPYVMLEPSAGIGSLAAPMAEHVDRDGGTLDLVEANYALCQVLKARGWGTDEDGNVPRAACVNAEFMEWSGACGEIYDRIAMNPPFERRTDEVHVRRAARLLAPCGRLVSVMTRRGAESMVEDLGGEIVEVEEGAFKGVESFRQTGVSVCLYVLEK